MTSTQNRNLKSEQQSNNSCCYRRKRKPVISLREAQALANWHSENLKSNDIDAHEGSAFWILNYDYLRLPRRADIQFLKNFDKNEESNIHINNLGLGIKRTKPIIESLDALGFPIKDYVVKDENEIDEEIDEFDTAPKKLSHFLGLQQEHGAQSMRLWDKFGNEEKEALTKLIGFDAKDQTDIKEKVKMAKSLNCEYCNPIIKELNTITTEEDVSINNGNEEMMPESNFSPKIKFKYKKSVKEETSNSEGNETNEVGSVEEEEEEENVSNETLEKASTESSQKSYLTKKENKKRKIEDEEAFYMSIPDSSLYSQNRRRRTQVDYRALAGKRAIKTKQNKNKNIKKEENKNKQYFEKAEEITMEAIKKGPKDIEGLFSAISKCPYDEISASALLLEAELIRLERKTSKIRHKLLDAANQDLENKKQHVSIKMQYKDEIDNCLKIINDAKKSNVKRRKKLV